MSAPGAPLVAVRRLRKDYPGVRALADASLEVAAGEIVGLVGKNGAGKSTLIKILAGVEHPDAGEIAVDGDLVRLRDALDAQRLGFRFVHQELADVPTLSVAENLALSHRFPRFRLGLVHWNETRKRAAAVLERLGIAVDPGRPTGELTAVERRMVMIASALYGDARLVVLDEPTASLTPPEVVQLHKVMRNLREHGVAILYVSHRLEEIFGVCDRVVVMRDGETIAAAETTDVTRGQLLTWITGDANAERREHQHLTSRGTLGRELLRVEGIGRENAVRHVSFSLRAGEILGLGGLVGSGRTELARLLVGADRRDSGRILRDGNEIHLRSPADALRHGIVLLPEDRRNAGLILAAGIRENLTLAALRQFRLVDALPVPGRRRERARTYALMEQLDIGGGDAEKPVAQLSGGNQQKVVVGRWLLREPDVLIFDEPTLGIDVGVKEAIFQLIVELAERGKGVIFISSELRELERVCNRVLVLREGHPMAVLEGKELSEEQILEHCYAHA